MSEQTIPRGVEQTHAVILRPYTLQFLEDDMYKLNYDAIIGDLFGVNEQSYMVRSVVARPEPGVTIVKVNKTSYTILDQAMAILYHIYRMTCGPKEKEKDG